MSNKPDNSIYSKPLIFSVIALVVILIGSVITAFYPLIRADMHPKLDNLHPYTPFELAGRDIYQREGCGYCHSQNVRPLKTDVLRYGAYSQAGESAYERPFLWGSRRTGPDLARAGGKYHDNWHTLHTLNPRHFSPKSNMPAYPWLENALLSPAAVEANVKAYGYINYSPADIQFLEGKTELAALTAYIQSLGRGVKKEGFGYRVGTVEDYKNFLAKGVRGTVDQGQGIYTNECAGCHGVDGKGSAQGKLSEGISTMNLKDAREMGYEAADMYVQIFNGLEQLMPPYGNVLSSEQIDSLILYIETLERR
ncbi:MAG: cbb3-type cytochrome c oxidase subunit II [Deferribacteraceae bacterium]|jgi:cytochrome c oxidase cbb3-type subunit 2|nr:cbb3-type cytochrome c oxidase subunit II [Deferribacteraceae bacterium]